MRRIGNYFSSTVGSLLEILSVWCVIHFGEITTVCMFYTLWRFYCHSEGKDDMTCRVKSFVLFWIDGVFMVLATMCEGETEKLCWMTFFRYHENIFIVNWLLFPFSHKSTSKVQYRCWVAPIWRYSSSQRCWMGLKTGLCLVSTHQTGKPRCWPCAQGACETAAHFLFPTQEFGNHHSYQLTLTKCLLLKPCNL